MRLHQQNKKHKFLQGGLLVLGLTVLGCAAELPITNKAPGSLQTEPKFTPEQALANFIGPIAAIQEADPIPFPGTSLSLRYQRAMIRLAKERAKQDPQTFYRNHFNDYRTLPKAMDFKTQAIGGADKSVYAVGYDLSGANKNFLYQLDPVTGNVSQLIATYNNIYSAAVAKNPLTGKVFYSNANSPYQLYSYDFNNGQNVLIGNLPFKIDPRMAFAPNGKLYGTRNNAGTLSLYEINTTTAATTAVTLTGWPATVTGGDMAFAMDGTCLMIGNDRLYDVDIPGGKVTYLANLDTKFSASGSTAQEAVAGTGFDDQGRFLVSTYRYSSGTQRSYLYSLDLTTYAATLIKTYTMTNTLADMTSAHYSACPDTTAGAPASPTSLLNQNFVGMPTNFANLYGETNPDLTTGWQQWNGDYYPASNGVVLWNPGPGNGLRNAPGEYTATRPDLLETAIYKDIPLNYKVGDKLVAKLQAAPTFSHADSDITLMVVFNDTATTVAVSNSLKGTSAVTGELFVEAAIPACATSARVIAYAYLGQNETSSVAFKTLTVDQIPGSYYTDSLLFHETLDTPSTHVTYGDGFPAGMDDQFSSYDFYTVPNWPLKYTGDNAITTSKAGSADAIGGLVKTVNLGTYTAGSKLTGMLYASATFTDPTSEASFYMEFYNATNTLLGTVNASKVTGSQYRWLNIDRATIPVGASYVKLVPVVKLGASETSSMLWDDLKVIIHQP